MGKHSKTPKMRRRARQAKKKAREKRKTASRRSGGKP